MTDYSLVEQSFEYSTLLEVEKMYGKPLHECNDFHELRQLSIILARKRTPLAEIIWIFDIFYTNAKEHYDESHHTGCKLFVVKLQMFVSTLKQVFIDAPGRPSIEEYLDCNDMCAEEYLDTYITKQVIGGMINDYDEVEHDIIREQHEDEDRMIEEHYLSNLEDAREQFRELRRM